MIRNPGPVYAIDPPIGFAGMSSGGIRDDDNSAFS